jgi:hypothetical protein
VVDGAVVDTKPIRVVMDPQVRFTAQERVAYDRTANELHAVHGTVAPVVARLNTLRTQLTAITARIDTTPGVTDAEKASVTALRTQYDALREKFGLGVVGSPAAPGGGGGFGGFGNQNPANVYGRFTGLKSSILGIWETPSAGTMAQVRQARIALDAAVREANTLLAQAVRVGQSIAPRGLTLAP